jgi:hypothetical protein
LQNYEFDVVHLSGKDNFVTDFLSRYPIHIDQEASDNKPEPNSLQDVDHFHFLYNMDVDQIVKDFAVHARDPIIKRRRNCKVYEMLPLDVETSAELGDEEQNTFPQLSTKSLLRRDSRHC